MNPAHILVITGELSGEQHAARLVTALQKLQPDWQFFAMGNDTLRNAGAEIVVDNQGLGVMGFVEVLRIVGKLRKIESELIQIIAARKINCVILVDYPGFNLRLAKKLRKNFPELKIFYYIAPKMWAWGSWRTKKLRNNIDKVFSILPFEEEWFAKYHVHATYVGNPVVDAVNDFCCLQHVSDAVGSIIKPPEVGVLDHARIALFPGSRRSEIERHAPIWAKTVSLLLDKYPHLQFVLQVPESLSALAESYFQEHSVEVVQSIAELKLQGVRTENYHIISSSFNTGQDNLENPETTVNQTKERKNAKSLQVIANCDLLLAKSGTTTLEAALLDKPMIVGYCLNPLSAAITRHFLLKIPWVSLPNICLHKAAVPEYLQEQCTAEQLADAVDILLSQPEVRARQRQDFAELRLLLGQENSANRAAQAIVNELLS